MSLRFLFFIVTSAQRLAKECYKDTSAHSPFRCTAYSFSYSRSLVATSRAISAQTSLLAVRAAPATGMPKTATIVLARVISDESVGHNLRLRMASEYRCPGIFCRSVIDSDRVVFSALSRIVADKAAAKPTAQPEPEPELELEMQEHDPQKAIEERRKRRQAILEKYAAGSTPLSQSSGLGAQTVSPLQTSARATPVSSDNASAAPLLSGTAQSLASAPTSDRAVSTGKHLLLTMFGMAQAKLASKLRLQVPMERIHRVHQPI